METISICSGTAQGVAPVIVFRLDDGGQTFYHSTGIQAWPHEAERNRALRDKLEIHKLAMCKAYTLMQLKRMDMNDRIFEMQVGRVLSARVSPVVSSRCEPMYSRYLRYVEEIHKVGVVGASRYTQLLSKARKLWRFLEINGLTWICSIRCKSTTTRRDSTERAPRRCLGILRWSWRIGLLCSTRRLGRRGTGCDLYFSLGLVIFTEVFAL